jgi:photosystem II stability/assembly factor-like uncharacterized protein
VVTSPQRAYLAFRSWSSLHRTDDGGHTWVLLLNEPDENHVFPFSAAGISSIVFVDDEHGWITSQNLIFITTDSGTHWEMVEIQ